MISTLIVSVCLMADTPKPSAEDRQAYQSARAEVGRDADAHVKLALWCEAHGLNAERVEHLVMAATIDPAHAAARGLMGQVDESGKWRRPDDVADRVNADPALSATLAAYAERRERAPKTADGQWKLGLWCEENGLNGEARAHFTTTVRLDPSRDAAWKRLGRKKVNGRWVSTDQIAEAKVAADVQKAADRLWNPILEKARNDLKVPSRRAAAEATLAAVSDPLALPSAIRTFGSSRGEDGVRLLQILGQIDSPAASRALAALAIFGPDPQARRSAAETLVSRDPREWAGLVIGLIRDPIKFHVQPVTGPGTVGVLTIEGKDRDIRRLYRPPAAPGVQKGDQLIGYDDQGLPVIRRATDPAFTYIYGVQDLLPGWDGKRVDSMPKPKTEDPKVRASIASAIGSPHLSGLLISAAGGQGGAGYGAGGSSDGLLPYVLSGSEEQQHAAAALMEKKTPAPTFYFTRQPLAQIPIGRMEFEAQRGAVAAASQMDEDVAALKAHNAPIQDLNARATAVLESATGQPLGEERSTWQFWLTEQMGFRGDLAGGQNTRTRPAFVQDVPLNFTSPEIPIAIDMPIVAFLRVSCFGAGTPVRTLTGSQPIESLAIGDRVLAQDVATGRMSYEPVLFVHRNPPSPTFRVDLGGEPVVASAFHRFWLAGKGWKMARDLKPGDAIRTVDGVVKVTAVEPEKTQPVFNLDVASSRTFFVGKTAALVHDNSVPDFRASPFDVPASLAKAKEEAPR